MKYRAHFTTNLNLAVVVDAEGEDEAADLAWERANDFLSTVWGDGRRIHADASLDGIGADEVVELP